MSPFIKIQRICGKCNKDFIATTSHNKFCKNCQKKRWQLTPKKRTWELSNKGKEYMREYHAQYKSKYKQIVYEHYGWKCNCCSETLDTMLTVDHVNNDGYLDRKLNISGGRFYKKIVDENLPNTYQILCMNCNWSKRINKGICQHKI